MECHPGPSDRRKSVSEGPFSFVLLLGSSLVGDAPALLTSWTAKAEGCGPFTLYFLSLLPKNGSTRQCQAA